MKFSIDALFKLLDSQTFNPEGKQIEGLNVIENHFYNHLPQSFDFTYANEVGRRLNISSRTVSYYLNHYQEKNCLLKIDRGHYIKISPIQRDLSPEIIARQEYLISIIRQTSDEVKLDSIIAQLSSEEEYNR